MELVLYKKPKNPIIIEGFPGFGFVGAISSQFLVEHLNAKPIGFIYSNEISPLVAIHKNELVRPLTIYYSEKHNIVILNALTPVNGFEWKIAKIIEDLYKTLKAKEVICLEGVNALVPNNQSQAYYQTTNTKSQKKLDKLGLKQLGEGVILGVTGAVVLKNMPVSCIFAEAQMGLPDSRAAAKVIEVLDGYLGLKVDYKPLLKKAQEMEGKIKDIIGKTREAQDMKDKKELDYFG